MITFDSTCSFSKGLYDDYGMENWMTDLQGE